MAQEFTPSSGESFATEHVRLIEELYREARCSRWNLTNESFAEALRRSAASRFQERTASAEELAVYLKSLRLEDLALACACAEGIEAAWEFFVGSYRQDLQNAARSILRSAGSKPIGTGIDVRAEELADSLYAELYGVRGAADGRRKSLFEYFHGRSTLATWLRAVLAQRHVDLLRVSGRTVSLDDDRTGETIARLEVHATRPCDDPYRAKYLAMIDCALSIALSELSSRERMVLGCYYLDALTLAQIGCMLREHESTVSRQLERTRRALRECVTDRLRQGIPAREGCAAYPALDEAQIELTFQYALEDWPFDLSRALSRGTSDSDPSVK